MVANSQEGGRERIFALLNVFPVVQNLEKKRYFSKKFLQAIVSLEKERRNSVGFYQIYSLFICSGLILLLLRYKGRLPFAKGAY